MQNEIRGLKVFEVGNVVCLLQESKYHGIVGTIIAINNNGNLVRFNGIQQLYFPDEDLKLYKKEHR